MTRTPIAAAIAASFLFSAAALAQSTATSGSGSANAMTGNTGASASSMSKGSDTRSGSASKELDRADRKFVENAALDGMKEVEAGRTVSAKAQDPGVKAFAERMVKDHGDANKKLMDLAQTKGITPPTDLRKSDRRELDKMAKMDPAKLDRAYMDDMVKDHKKDVKAFEKEAKDAKDPDLKKFAADTLPVLQEHLQMAEDTDSKVKGGGGSAATRNNPKTASTNSAGGDTGKK